MNGHLHSLAWTQHPLLRMAGLKLSILHFSPDEILSTRFDDRAGEHDPSFERFNTFISKSHLNGHGTISHLVWVEAGSIHEAFDTQSICPHNAGQWVTRLHPFAEMRIDTNDNAIKRCQDFPTVDRVFSSRNVNLL
jgi:hypothetical protein